MSHVIKQKNFNDLIVRLAKQKTPVFGGFYRVELVKDKEIVRFVDGLNPDASTEIFARTVLAAEKEGKY